ncbi:MAG TPA: hypothetical protein VM345_15475 [Acidimicrobiales bacterium]|jgi:pimeloyl-ACP methyl ester carboxylesterase|nr:hypothetical protein [Acidimicrobiales bacterium]
MSRLRGRIVAAVVVLLAGVGMLPSSTPASASKQVVFSPYQRGPAPDRLDLGAPLGPFTYESISRSALDTPIGMSGGTIYYPSEEAGTFGTIAIAPGWTNTQSAVAWYGPLLASHGFVVMTIDTNSRVTDLPRDRATQLLLALDYLVSDANPVRSKVDPDRLAVAGYSMGGGGAIEATSRRPSIKASVPLTPWHTTKTFEGIRTPTLVVGAQNDSTASVASHAIPLYEGLPAELPKAYAELREKGHSLPTSHNPVVAKLTVSWMKRFVDTDYRFDAVLCPPPNDTTTFSDYRSTCPYTPDADGDTVSDAFDSCPDTGPLPEPVAVVPGQGPERFSAAADGRFVAATGVDSGVTMLDTGGCSAAQIKAQLGLREPPNRFGVTREVLDQWITTLHAA